MRRSLALSLSLSGIAVLGVPAAFARAAVDKTHLPVGKTSTSAQKGRLWTCQTNFSANAPGAFKDGPWMNGDGTWDATKKISVSGSVSWPNANLSVKVSGTNRVITGNALPVNATSGTYPVATTDAAYNYDRNPNSIRAQSISLTLVANPKLNTTPQCVGGEVGISLAGPPIFNAVDAGGRDAQAYEIQDTCSGHPQESGVYHYHGLSACTDRSKQFGWALDGLPIWGPVDPSTGQELTNDDLDECHGTTSRITIDGKAVTMYHYVANDQYPYTVGCFRATPSSKVTVGGKGGGGQQQGGNQQQGGQQGSGQQGNQQQGGGQQPGGNPPPPGAPGGGRPPQGPPPRR